MKRLLILTAILCTIQAHASEWIKSSEIEELFKAAHAQGTFVLYDVEADQFVGYDRVRAETRFVPASTYKIPNTLIGLSVGAVDNVDEVLPYGGHHQPFKAWEKDMGLRDAIAISNIPIYQELARRIGPERMREGISKIGYGNQDIGPNTSIGTFWLVGPLKISALEQTKFLAKLAKETLPFSQDQQKKVREIITLEQGDNWKLYGKTGWENAPGAGIGWWVGWVEKGNRIYPFALNIDIREASDAAKRLELGKASLKALKIL
ncbi:class D beta-lactamase [Azotobacter chroococcum]|jgi:beta-lactamase class D|uniref:class D beta-lactamase n=1 Tax=Azotobacter chroococcum TaxID=353 RepID=UPI00103BAD6D|nr:class D beta-lactamase [Azotobacter chroococcum]TBW32522.1 class D beta-lactamase [Azotobacter chroococcum]